MRLPSERDALELQAIVDAVPADLSQCIGAEQLAARTKLPIGRVEYLLRQHPRYFVNVAGKHAYSLSRLASHGGSRAKIVAEIEASLCESARASRLGALVPFAALSAAAGVVIAFLFGRQQWIAALFVAFLPPLAFVCIALGGVARRRRAG